MFTSKDIFHLLRNQSGSWSFLWIFILRVTKNPPKRVKCGCVEDAWHVRGGGDFSPPGLLLLRFVSCEDSDLRLAGSDSYLAEVFPRYQCRHYDG